MDIFLKLFLVLSLSAVFISNVNCANKNVTASGGGIAKPGDTLTLRYVVGKAWDRCYWYRYRHHSDFEYCSFDSKSSSRVDLHKCQPANLNQTMSYFGTSQYECTIQIRNITDDDNCTWAARVDDDLMPLQINVTVASPVVIVVTGTPTMLQADIPGKVECNITGGRPAPNIAFDFKTNGTKPQILNNTQKQTPDDNGIYTTLQEVFILPKISDHGAKIFCEALIFDGDSKPIFDSVKANETFLNITFAPQTAPNQTLTGFKGNNFTVKFNFQANPKPQDVKWTILGQQHQTKFGRNSGASQNVTLTAGQTTTKYNASVIVAKTDINFTSELTIFNLADEDAFQYYTLEVQNVIGKQVYSFKLQVQSQLPNSTLTPGGPETTTKPPVHEGSGHSVGYAFLGLIIFGALAAVLVVVYKKTRPSNETAPLQGQTGQY